MNLKKNKNTLSEKGFTISKNFRWEEKVNQDFADKIHTYQKSILPSISVNTTNRHTFSKEKRFKYNYIIKDF